MAKITITFQEEGREPTIVVIPEEISETLDDHVEYLNSEGANLSGKTELFVKMTWENWLKPVLEKQGKSIVYLAGEIGSEYVQAVQEAEIKRKLVELAAIRNTIKIQD